MTVRRWYTLKELANDEEKLREIIAIAKSPPRREDIKAIEQRLAQYEAKYGLSSTEARQRVQAGTLAPTYEVEGWLMAIELRDHLLAALK